jgi:hypothetical protein
MLEPVVKIWRLKRKSKSGGFLPGLFFQKNPLYVWKSYFWARKNANISLPEKNTCVIGWIAEINGHHKWSCSVLRRLVTDRWSLRGKYMYTLVQCPFKVSITARQVTASRPCRCMEPHDLCREHYELVEPHKTYAALSIVFMCFCRVL